MEIKNVGPEVKPVNDRIVWVQGTNGVQCIKWLSKIGRRTDLAIIGDYDKGDQFPGDMAERKAKAEKEAEEAKKATTTKAPAKTTKAAPKE